MAGISVFFICISVISFCLKTHPGLRVSTELPSNILNHHNIGIINASDPILSNENLSITNRLRANETVPYRKASTTISPIKSTTSTTTVKQPFWRGSRFGTIQSEADALWKNDKKVFDENWQETYGQPHEAFFYVELVCNIWFIIELTVRFVVSYLLICFPYLFTYYFV